MLPYFKTAYSNFGPAPFASLKKQAVTLFQVICCERKILFRLKNKLKKTDYKRNEYDAYIIRILRYISSLRCFVVIFVD